MFFRKFMVAVFMMLVMAAGVAAATPVSVEGSSSALVDRQDLSKVDQTLGTQASSGQQVTAFALYNEKSANDVEAGTVQKLMSDVPLPPALILFGGALAAIVWLGRRRRSEHSNWE